MRNRVETFRRNVSTVRDRVNYFGEVNRDRVLCEFNLLVQLLELSEVIRRSEIVVADF
jgi:hypothetical protein